MSEILVAVISAIVGFLLGVWVARKAPVRFEQVVNTTRAQFHRLSDGQGK